jgi:DNA-binding NarL/FixJ family response regulator
MKLTILIVEDHDGVRFLLYDFLSDTFPYCRFLEAKNGEEAVALALAQSPEIILMDISLPKMNGIEATRRIKDAQPQTHVVIVTNHEADEFQREAYAVGACAYVLKHRMQTELVPVLTKLFSHLRVTS